MGRAIVSFLFAVVVIGVLAAIGGGIYQAGIAQGIVDAGRFPAGSTVPVAGYGWHGPGIFGLLFGLFFLFLLFGLARAAFGGRGRGWGGGYGFGYGPRHGWGPGWGPGAGQGFEGGPEAWRDERDRRIADLHRRLHEAEGTSGSGGSSASGSNPA